MLDKLRRLVHLEVDAEHRDSQCEPAEIVIARPVLAPVRAPRLDRAPVGGDAAADLPRGGVKSDSCLEPVGRPADALFNVCDRILGGQLALAEADAGRHRFAQAVDSKRPPVLAATIPG